MGNFGGFFKGEKRKKKKGQEGGGASYAPVFTPPQIIGKGKKPKEQ